MQPIVSDDVAAALADVVEAEPLNDTIELAGPEQVRMDELIRRYLSAKGDSRKVIADPEALYYGVKVNDQSLTPGVHPRLGTTRFEEWLKGQPNSKKPAPRIGCGTTKSRTVRTAS